MLSWRWSRVSWAGLAFVLSTALVSVWSTQPVAAAGSKPTLVGGQEVSPAGAGGRDPAIASSGSKTIIVWTQAVAGPGSSIYQAIYGRIMSPDSTTIGDPFVIGYTSGQYAAHADVAWNGSKWLVVWAQQVGTDSNIEAKLVTPAHAVSDATYHVSTAANIQDFPAVAAGSNGQFLVAWADYRNVASLSIDVYSARVSSTGTVLDKNGVRLSYGVADTDEYTPDVAWNGSDYMTVWEAIPSAGYQIQYDLRTTAGARAAHGTVTSRDTSGALYNPAIASDGTTFVVVYEDDRGSSLADITGVRYDPSNGLGDEFLVSSAPNDQTHPFIAYSGDYLVTWEDQRENDTDNGNTQIYGTRITPNGTVTNPDGFLLTHYNPYAYRPAVAPGAKAQQFGWVFETANQTSGIEIAAYGMNFSPK
jgi:hypothetical protein